MKNKSNIIMANVIIMFIFSFQLTIVPNNDYYCKKKYLLKYVNILNRFKYLKKLIICFLSEILQIKKKSNVNYDFISIKSPHDKINM